jgi:ribonuclease P/MRP protein subunit POP1
MMANESMPILANTPRDLNIADFVVNRMDEIVDLLNVIDNHELPIGEVTQGPRTTLQRLPRHMRRRAMSYNVKRLPRNRRHFAMINTAMSMKRRRDMATSRRWRRRPHNLLKVFATDL